MDAVIRFGAATVLMVGTLLIGFAATDMAEADGTQQYDSVAALMSNLPTEQQVVITANVSDVMEDHVSESGNTYQQFYITNGEKEVLVFCGTFNGRVDVSTGDRVRVSGEFQKFYDQYEIYTECPSIKTVAGT